jgi:hypothetical protein
MVNEWGIGGKYPLCREKGMSCIHISDVARIKGGQTAISEHDVSKY